MHSTKPFPPPNRSSVVEEEIDDIDAFVRELTGCQDDLLLFIRTMSGDFHIASDIRQEVNMVLWRKRRQFIPGTSFRSWAYRVAHIEVKSNFRKVARRRVIALDPDLLECMAEELPEVAGDVPERRLALGRCMERLTPKDRELILHRYWSDKTLESLATASKRSVGTLKARLFQLRTSLRLCINDRLRELQA